MFEEFKKFALKGNVIDLAIGVIIGGAFSKIVSSLVDDILMPVLGLILGQIDLSSLKIVIKAAEGDLGELSIKYGSFVQSIIDFLIIGISLFFITRIFLKLRKKEEDKAKEPKLSKEEELLTEIRDILKEKQ
ncbi:MAG: large-conductance mechanosensitive channel protein MscL [Epulopiscium sp.]|jgi:large conductance mechanosensitive channel|nr:large-conductance mechanosensitive channel protein MscL [Candidatus Epulonipiscium sp.]